MDVLTILLSTIVACVIAYTYTIYKNLKIFEYAGIPYLPGLPIVGSMAPVLFRKIHVCELYQNFYNMFPNAKYFGMFDFDNPIIMIRDPELIKKIAIKNFDNFTDHLGFTTKGDKVFGNNLFSLKGDRWRAMRSLLSPAFTSSKLKQTFEFVSAFAKSCAEYVKDNVTKGTSEFEMKEFVTRYTNDVICKYAFGINIDSIQKPNNEIYLNGREVFAFNGPLSTRFFLLKNFSRISEILRIPLFSKAGTDFFSSIIKNTVIERKKHKIVESDMLQVMIDSSMNPDSKVKIDRDDIISQTFIFFLAGFETTASYLSSTLYLLATHQDVQEKLLAEIDEMNDKTNGTPSYEDIQKMEYLNGVVNEAGRMYTPLPYLDRLCTKPFELPPSMPGYPSFTISPGTTVYFPSYALQHDPQYFPDPEKFDPDRFQDKSINYDTGYYMPFGIGRRSCIGTRLAMINMKLMLFHLLSQVSVKPSSKTATPMKFATDSFIVLPHDNKVWLGIEKRNK